MLGNGREPALRTRSSRAASALRSAARTRTAEARWRRRPAGPPGPARRDAAPAAFTSSRERCTSVGRGAACSLLWGSGVTEGVGGGDAGGAEEGGGGATDEGPTWLPPGAPGFAGGLFVGAWSSLAFSVGHVAGRVQREDDRGNDEPEAAREHEDRRPSVRGVLLDFPAADRSAAREDDVGDDVDPGVLTPAIDSTIVPTSAPRSAPPTIPLGVGLTVGVLRAAPPTR